MSVVTTGGDAFKICVEWLGAQRRDLVSSRIHCGRSGISRSGAAGIGGILWARNLQRLHNARCRKRSKRPRIQGGVPQARQNLPPGHEPGR